MAKTVNLDAMITREDFSTIERDRQAFDRRDRLGLSELEDGNPVLRLLRKPDFQRETNHWSPEQVVSLLQCFADGDLIPSIILWDSRSYLFVIDGGHRLSALRAWVLDDYGDGPTSLAYFGADVSRQQRKAAEATRKLVSSRLFPYSHYRQKSSPATGSPDDQRVSVMTIRTLPIQWVQGNAEKAEDSFFKINTKGTPLDSVEEQLLKNRRKPIAIGARAIIRSGKGHKYWSAFPDAQSSMIEQTAQKLHALLFRPELESPIRSLDVPLAGPVAVRNALEALVDYLEVCATKPNQNDPWSGPDDVDGGGTVALLQAAERVTERLTGNGSGSLGLHPIVYFYGPSARHSMPMFMGTVQVVHRALVNNNSEFFKRFTRCRKNLEAVLLEQKEVIASILQNTDSRGRSNRYAELLGRLIAHIDSVGAETLTPDLIVQLSGLDVRVMLGSEKRGRIEFGDDVKSAVLIEKSLQGALKCSICGGYLDPAKSISYDHIIPRRDGGGGAPNNCGLTHPYCNQSVKC